MKIEILIIVYFIVFQQAQETIKNNKKIFKKYFIKLVLNFRVHFLNQDEIFRPKLSKAI